MCGRASALLAMAVAQSASQAGGVDGHQPHVQVALAWVRLVAMSTSSYYVHVTGLLAAVTDVISLLIDK